MKHTQSATTVKTCLTAFGICQHRIIGCTRMHNMLQQCYFEAYFHLPSQSFTFVSFFLANLYIVSHRSWKQSYSLSCGLLPWWKAKHLSLALQPELEDSFCDFGTLVDILGSTFQHHATKLLKLLKPHAVEVCESRHDSFSGVLFGCS